MSTISKKSVVIKPEEPIECQTVVCQLITDGLPTGYLSPYYRGFTE